MKNDNPKVAIIHDWLVTYGGAERVLKEIITCFPEASLYVVLDFLPENRRGFLKNKLIKTSFIQALPWAKKIYWYYIAFMPIAVEQFDLSSYDIIISSSHSVAKGIIVAPDQFHISYVHSPIRFAWDLQNYYLDTFGYRYGIKSLLARLVFHYLRIWDISTINRTDKYVANSNFISRRISKYYGKQSTVIYPAIDEEYFGLCKEKEDFYLTASFMNPFKKIDLIVEAFSSMTHRNLIIIGDGPDFSRIKSKSQSNIKFLGYLTDDDLRSYMQRAKAFVFAAPEDFGMIMAEAQACGTPVIAYAKGGAVEIVQDLNQDKPTGVLFNTQTVESIVEAVDKFEYKQDSIKPENCRNNVLRFSKKVFHKKFKSIVYDSWVNFKN